MRHLCSVTTWLFGSLAITLMTLGCLAVPTQMAFADPGCEDQCAIDCGALYEVGTPEYNNCVSQCLDQCGLVACPNSSGCSNGCYLSQTCFVAGCTNVSGCKCDKDTYDPNCSSRCKCRPAGSACECGKK